MSLRELEAQLAVTRQALGAVVLLAKETLEATVQERWDRAQYIAKLESRLKKLEKDYCEPQP